MHFVSLTFCHRLSGTKGIWCGFACCGSTDGPGEDSLWNPLSHGELVCGLHCSDRPEGTTGEHCARWRNHADEVRESCAHVWRPEALGAVAYSEEEEEITVLAERIFQMEPQDAKVFYAEMEQLHRTLSAEHIERVAEKRPADDLVLDTPLKMRAKPIP